ncbi:unnamed protein product [Paramecium sonneborni]|uniref:Uncharacterized protein n=1 Tax=Paramecium sonneborni TaxID=65129 RepID=A0A8S1PJ46_9CILI|nr:unnamed protein product [Paramecium sonneborni]
MKHNKQQSHYILDFQDIEDISDNESMSSEQSNKQQQINQVSPIGNRIEQLNSILQVKKETVEIPSIVIQEQEEPIIRRKVDIQKQQWSVNFDELSEQEQLDSDRSQCAIEIQKDPSPPTITIEEPQYIEQYFEDQNVIEEIDIEQEQLKLEQRKEQLKQDLITKKQQQQQKQKTKIQSIQQEPKKIQEINQIKSKNLDDKIKQKYKQKFYNPKNSLIYLRLKGREDLYKKQEQFIDEQTKPPDQDELLEGLECINSLLIGLSKIKDKKLSNIEKQKMLPLQIQKHRLDDKGEHHKESKLQKNTDKDKNIEQQKKIQQEVQKEKDQKQNESIIKQQQLQEAQQARQIRHEKQQQEKEKLKLMEQRQIYKILTKKQINQGLILYKCHLKQKQKDTIKWLRYSEIALISKGEIEIFNFEKRMQDQLFMQIHKTNMISILITKQAIFDRITIHYVEEQKQPEEIQQKQKESSIQNLKENQHINSHDKKQVKEKRVIKITEQKKKVLDNQINDEKDIKSIDDKQQKDKLKLKDKSQEDQLETKRIKNKVSYLESDEEKKDEDLLDADSIQIFKITQNRQRKFDKKEKNQLKSSQNNQQQIEEQKQIESIELSQKNNINQSKEQKKNKNQKITEYPLSRLETNDEIKKKQKINQKRKEKRSKEYHQQVNDIVNEQNHIIAISKQKKVSKNTKNQEAENQIIKQIQNNQEENDKIQNITNEKDIQEPNNSNSTKVQEESISKNNKSPSSKSLPKLDSIEPGYVSSKRIYESRNQKKKRMKIIEDEESEYRDKQNDKNQLKKRTRQK